MHSNGSYRDTCTVSKKLIDDRIQLVCAVQQIVSCTGFMTLNIGTSASVTVLLWGWVLLTVACYLTMMIIVASECLVSTIWRMSA